MDRIGPYRIEEELGSGGFGTVYKCVHEHLDRVRALKVLHDPTAIDTIITEARNAVKLRHPNIVELYELDHQADPPYAVFEYIEGRDLARRIAEDGPAPWEKAVEIMVAVLAGLQHAHDHGVIHRDIKPGNILLANDGAIKLSDFGLGCAAQRHSIQQSMRSGTFRQPSAVVSRRSEHSGGEGSEQPGTIGGTILYMSPQQLGDVEPSIADDIYAAGVVLYELLTGEVPMGRYRSASEVRAEAPEGLDEIIDRALAYERGDRYSSAREMRAALLALIGASPHEISADEIRDEPATKVPEEARHAADDTSEEKDVDTSRPIETVWDRGPGPQHESRGTSSAPASKSTNRLAIASLILGILGPGTGIVGVILGIVALKQINREESAGGRNLAIGGISLSIIWFLVAGFVVYPKVLQGLQDARRLSCMSNVKQIMLGINMYSQDYDEMMPLVASKSSSYVMPKGGTDTSGLVPWQVAIYPYFQNHHIYNCPSAATRWTGGEANTSDSENPASCNATGYGYNQECSGVSTGDFSNAFECCAVADKSDKNLWYLASRGSQNGRNDIAIDRHLGGCIVGYVDGHAKWLKADNVPEDTFDGSNWATKSKFWDPDS